MRTLMSLMALVFTFSSEATVTTGSCPEEFEGRVKVIAEELGPQEAFSTQQVVFKNWRTLKGDVPEQVSVNMLINGPFTVEAGSDYRVQLRNGKLCWIERL